MLKNKNMNNLQSERLRHFPNVNSLMKISLGLIFFTVLSTALVYAETISVDIDGTSFDIPYTATGMTVTGIESDTESISLIFSVDVTDLNGIVNIEFQRSFFDSIYDETDDLFFILADGDEAISEEIQNNSQSRSLTIKVPSGTEDLEIIGSVFNNPELKSIVAAPVVAAPVVAAPVVAAPVVAAPVVAAPVVAAPVVAAPVVADKDNNECGPGTVLENNICVLDQRCGPGTVLENNILCLDQRCGPGTVLQDDACVLDSTAVKSSSSNTKELITSVTIAFVIAGIIGIIFAIISRANRTSS